MVENLALARFSVMILLLRMATLAGSSSPVAVSMTLDPSEMRMEGAGASPDTVRCHVTGTGVARTSESSVWLLDPAGGNRALHLGANLTINQVKRLYTV